MSSTPLKSIPETFADADVFITGGSGFMGKVLIEKLLRSCPEVSHVFVLMRARKGKSAKERVNELVQSPVFGRLREEQPEVFRKIVPIAGDCAQLYMGLQEESVQQLRSVQFVFHTAASVRFDDPLEKAILMNTRGTREALQWAKTLPDLRAFVHVSTSYCNPDVFEVEERIYPAEIDWRKVIEMAEKVDPEVLETLSRQLTKFAPNTYTFTKHLAEQICNDYREDLPLVIFRPSIVINTELEPMPAWIENYNGPAGLLSAHAAGVLRAMYVNLDSHMNCVPADACIKAILVAAWKRAYSPKGQLPVYNGAVERHKAMGYKFLVDNADYFSYRIPMLKMLWTPSCYCTTNRHLYYLLYFWYQVLPAMFIDFALKVGRAKPFMLKLQRTIFHAQVSLMYFTENDWQFVTNNFLNLSKYLCKSDRANFNTDHITQGLLEYCSLCMLGGRRYLFKESDDSIPTAFTRLRRFELVDFVLKLVFVGVFAYVLSKYFYVK